MNMLTHLTPAALWVMGRKFFDVTIPKVILQVERLNDNLEYIIMLLENNETAVSDLLKEDVKNEQDT